MNAMTVYCGLVVILNLGMLTVLTGAWGPIVGLFSLLLNIICGVFFGKFWRKSVLRHYKMYPLVD